MLNVASEYAYDVFISYAHLDNQPLIPGKKGWVSDLHDVLSIRLSMLRGENARIWRDGHVRRNELFDDSIAKVVKSAKLFLSVLTPRYVRSDYCRRELQEFTCGGMPRTADRSRLFKVLKTPVPREEHPISMKNILGYEFYDIDEETRHMREYCVDSERYREIYLSRLDDLAQEIHECLTMMEAEPHSPTDPAVPSSSATAASVPQCETVYVCMSSSDVRGAHDQVRRELSERGHAVLPNQPPTLESKVFDAEVRSALMSADLSVHIIGKHYGIIPENGLRSIVEIQNDIASAVSQKQNLERIIWIPEDLAPEDERQLRFIEQLRNDPAAQCNADLIVGSIEELKGDILAKLSEIRHRKKLGLDMAGKAQSVPPSTNKAPPWVYLIKGPYDHGEVSVLEDCLWDVGMEVLKLSFDEDLSEAELAEEHLANLKQADICIVYYGQSPERWVRKQLSDIRKAGGQKREKPMLAAAVYIGGLGSKNDQKSKFRSNSATVIWPNGAEPREAIASFITVLEESRCAS